jgi:hypothetical protein
MDSYVFKNQLIWHLSLFRYNALTKTWKEDNVVVKMETDSFGQGAMRQCYRL